MMLNDEKPELSDREKELQQRIKELSTLYEVNKVLAATLELDDALKLIVETTDRASQTYNQLCHSQRVVAALHLTC